MSVYRTSSIPAPLRTEVSAEDLRHLDVLERILALLDEPAASATELARLVDQMPVLVARLRMRFTARRTSNRPNPGPSTVASELAMLGNRDFEVVLFELLEDLTCLRAEQEGVPPHGSIYPRLMSVHPPHATATQDDDAASPTGDERELRDGATGRNSGHPKTPRPT